MQENTLLSIQNFCAQQDKIFWAMVENFGFSHERDYFEKSIERHIAGELLIVLACLNHELVGYALLNRQPKYALFKKLGLPEIQDLNVLKDYRKQGIGAAIISYCEDLARTEGYDEIGIGVGLDHSFGAAQRLYARLGYIPDGTGVSYDRKQIAAGEFRPIDENLCLMMTKKL